MQFNNDDVKKAKTLFLTKGILRRDLLRNEIAFSWVRSNLYKNRQKNKIIENNYIFFDDKKVDFKILLEFIKIESNIKFKKSSLFICDYNGNVICSNNEWLNKKNINSLREEDIGTNGIGIFIKNKKNSVVYFSEHYNSVFEKFISAAYYLNSNKFKSNIIIGLLAISNEEFIKVSNTILNIDLEKTKFTIVDSDLNLDEKNSNEYIEEYKLKNQISKKTPEVLFGDSKYIHEVKKKLLNENLNKSIISIIGPSGIGKEEVARFFAFKNFSGERIIKIDSSHDTSSEIEKKLNTFTHGVLIVENINDMTIGNFRKIEEISRCKVVNTNRRNDVSAMGLGIILLHDNLIEFNRSVNRFTDKLQHYPIVLKSLNTRRDDIKKIVKALIYKVAKESGCKVEDVNNRILVKDVLSKILNKTYHKNMRELHTIIDNIINLNDYDMLNNTKNKSEVNIELSTEKTLKLEDVEKYYIRQTFNKYDGNISLISEKLGISRSTLYRKLKKYEIEH
ncbi:helix-turn-helix domain-containing protein [Helicovermis profundi]|uniref:Sigma 54-interacting transcriptional regulator n=1 Tax=Helicovermis profundi TaxID=3065157 RepID=A0AAU9E7G0_9FIRM|nr:sigma 54-interacting transcriptional regulator [Clostridia bacterium S502]